MRVSQKLIGWVAANRTTIVNSDAALDLAGIAPDVRTTAVSTPLLDGETLIGVLTLYGDAPSAFAQEHGRLLQMVAPHVARMLSVCRPAAAAAAAPARRVVAMPAKTDLRVGIAR